MSDTWQAKMYYVYIIKSDQDGSWYIGYTPDTPERRLKKHNEGTEYYTKRKKPWNLIYYEAYSDRRDATGREKFLKSGAGRSFLKKQLKYFLSIPSTGLPRTKLYAGR